MAVVRIYQPQNLRKTNRYPNMRKPRTRPGLVALRLDSELGLRVYRYLVLLQDVERSIDMTWNRRVSGGVVESEMSGQDFPVDIPEISHPL